MSVATVSTTQTIELTFSSSERFALSRVAVNDGIFDAHDHGILTSASLMANPSATTNAIGRLRFRPTPGIGVHLMLVDGTPMLPPDRVPTLGQDDGRFHASWRPFIVACLTDAHDFRPDCRSMAS